MMNPTPTVIRPADIGPQQSPQNQSLTPCVTTGTCGTTALSAGLVTMAPGTHSQPHYHAHTDIIVVLLTGNAATLYLDNNLQWTPLHHSVGEFCYIPAGIIHVAVNASFLDPLTAVESRTDPTFNTDVVLTPELADSARTAIAALDTVRRQQQP